MTFQEFNLHDDLLAGVDAMNYLKATPIQEMAIPKILEGRDLIASAQTGTGKTAAYLIPLLDRISHADHDHTSTLILVPTRELAKQIDEQVEGFGYFVQANSIAIYGGGKGDDWDKQRKALETGADIIIATPGRLIAHMQLGYVKFDRIDYLVLDEADKMLDMGFSDDIMNIVEKIPSKRQTLLFSATMPNKIREFSKKLLTDPEEIRLAVSKPAAGIDQQFYMAYDSQKLPLLAHLIQSSTKPVQSMVLFTSRKSEVNSIVRALSKLGYDARGISSDLEQDDREVVLRDFKNKAFPILVATDVLSRGIDIDNLTHVVNYDIPRDAEDYVHRIGRTARAATTGTAITFVSDQDQNRIVNIERLIEREVEKRSITEELGMGKSPEFDPKRFSGLRGKGSRGNAGSGRGGRDGNRGDRRSGSGSAPSGERREGNNDRRRDRSDDPNRKPRPEEGTRVEVPVSAVVDVAAPTELVNPNGQPSDKPKRRKKRRKPRGEGGDSASRQSQPTDSAPTAE
ncbi:Superfamily II DNA and RNA helicase [Spirosoma endophyticum]|uniref:Superfamily II DNA and RNA helicase n=2 Tax=Spirosoma endophyticum TaxID=662367 RepID=A0A1I1H9C5_9BACT|nr:Superfamily II DNA and RNA helicase [Spirosoma endophyticum]